MTDRDLLKAVFSAVAALAERVTGEQFELTVETETGELVSISSDCCVRWRKPRTEAAELSQSSDPAVFPATH